MAEDYQKMNENMGSEEEVSEISLEEKEAIDRKRSRKILKSFAKEITKTFVMIVFIWIAVYVVTHYLYGFIVVEGDSMNDTMFNDQVGIIQKFNTQEAIHRGDIIVFWSEEMNEYLIKRCVAIGGDTISITEDKVMLNGEIIEEDYIKEPMKWDEDDEIEEITLSEDELFAMGDNRNHSLDCRSLGPVNYDDVTGKLIINMGNYGITSKRLVVLIVAIFVVFLIISGIQDRKIKQKLNQIPEEIRNFDVDLEKSTCTGEMTIGFRNPYNHKLELMELVHNNKEIKAYCIKYAQDYKQLLKK